MKTFTTAVLATLLTFGSLAASADDARERQLELDVQQLRRELMAQARRIDELERLTVRGVKETTVTAPVVSPVLPAWLVAANWERVRTGMSEADVRQVLGTPTSVREGSSAERRTFFYALEVAPEAFLAGSVELAEGKVIEVRKPVLR
ncbi:MAG TPA: hypothetical protein VJ764_00780 [Steroidobacteraceae bacterium]|nr:hypothetical protein [Steroidobacteraceae bacterium]